MLGIPCVYLNGKKKERKKKNSPPAFSSTCPGIDEAAAALNRAARLVRTTATLLEPSSLSGLERLMKRLIAVVLSPLLHAGPAAAPLTTSCSFSSTTAGLQDSLAAQSAARISFCCCLRILVDKRATESVIFSNRATSLSSAEDLDRMNVQP